MRSTFYGIEIGRTGLTVSQKGLDVTGHNIANVNTAGYTRQRLITTAYDPAAYVMKFKNVELGTVGGGARVKILDQVRSSFLDRQYRTEQTQYSYWTTRTQGLSYVESLFEGDDAATLSAGIDNLFSAFNTLASEANDSAQRIVVRSAAQSLCDSFKQVYDRLVEQQSNQNLAVETVVGEINDIAESIAQLNYSIYMYELDGQPANDLRDKRNLLLDELSSLCDVSYEETGDNKFIVKVAGQELVNYMDVTKMDTESYVDELSGNTYSNLVWLDSSGQPLKDAAGDTIYITSKQLGGEIGSHMDLRDSTDSERPGIPYFMEKMNTLARAIVEAVNGIHSTGYTHPSNGTGSVTGVNFFDVPMITVATYDPTNPLADVDGYIYEDVYDYSQVTAASLSLSAEILASEFNIAASTAFINLDGTLGEELQEGNNLNAQLLYQISRRTDITLSDGTAIGGLHDFISGIVLEVATTLNQSKTYESNHNTQLLSVDNQRTSVCGVSLDEEMTNLIKYQHAYNGAARVITAMDDALETLINKMGRVGL